VKELFTKEKRRDFVVFLAYPIIASFLLFQLNLNFIWSIVLFFALPSVHLSALLPKSIKKTLTASLALGATALVTVDLIAHLNEVWYVPSIFPIRIFGLVPIEGLAWWTFLMYFTIMFYEYFFDAHRDRKILRPRMKYAFLIMLTVVIAVVLFLLFAPQLLNISFFYAWFGIILALLPVIIELVRRPLLIQKFLPTAAYFFLLAFIYEITALKLGYWSFPGDEAIGIINIFGVTFPFEEFFFWFILAAMAMLAYYEFFDDDEK